MSDTRRSEHSLIGELFWFGLSYGLAILGYLAINSIVSRWLGVAEYGYFVIAITVSTGIGQFALAGAHRAGLRDAAVMEPGDEAALQQLRGGASAAILITVPLISIISAVALYFVVQNEDGGTKLVMAVTFAALVYFSGMQKLWANYLRGLGDIRLASLLEGRSGGALVAVAQGVLLGLMWWLIPGLNMAGALLAATLGFAAPMLYVGARVRRRWKHLPRTTHIFAQLRMSLRNNWRFAVNQLATYVGGTVEIWLAGLLLIPEDTSLFSAAQRLALLLSIPIASMQVVFAPVSARLLNSGDTARLEKILRTGATLAAGFALILWLPTLLAPDDVLTLVYGSAFAGGAAALLVLSLGNAANVFAGLSGVVLTMSRREGVAATVQTATVILRVIFGALAAYQWGLMGIAASSATLSILMYFVMWWQARSLLGVQTHATLRPDWKSIRSPSE
jgi:O-antigen/teichoic acid export membrane protein